MTHLALDIHSENPLWRDSELREGCKITLEEVADELKAMNAEIYDHYLDLDRAEVIIDIEPESAYSLIILKGHWLKDYVRKS